MAKAAGSENRADGVAARRLFIGSLNNPWLGISVSIRKQWISLTNTSSELAVEHTPLFMARATESAIEA